MYPSNYKTGDEDDVPPWDYAPFPNQEDNKKYPYNYTTGHDYDPYTQTLKPNKHNKHMGDMADWALEQMDFDPSYEGTEDRPSIPSGFWKQKDGTLIEIKKMTDSHLKNCIALCERRGVNNPDLDEEMERRNQAADKIKRENDPIYDAFCAGWEYGTKSANDEAYPDVGFNIPSTKQSAWASYNSIKNSVQYLPNVDFDNALDRGWKGPGWYFWDEADGQYCYGPYKNKEIAIRRLKEYCDTL